MTKYIFFRDHITNTFESRPVTDMERIDSEVYHVQFAQDERLYAIPHQDLWPMEEDNFFIKHPPSNYLKTTLNTGLNTVLNTEPHDAKPSPTNDPSRAVDRTIQVVEERLEHEKVWRTTQQVTIHRRVDESTHEIDELCFKEEVVVDRYDKARPLKEGEPTEPHHLDDGTLVIPVLEERVVVTKQLYLLEEIHICQRRSEHPVHMEAKTRRSIVEVEREPMTDPAL